MAIKFGQNKDGAPPPSTGATAGRYAVLLLAMVAVAGLLQAFRPSSEVREAQALRDARAEVPFDPSRRLEGLDRSKLDVVADGSLVGRRAEFEAWGHVLHLLQATPYEIIKDASIGRVTFLQLDQQPAAYRGDVVTIGGRILRAEFISTPNSSHGVEGHYRLILQPEDRPQSLVQVFCLELPKGFPEGLAIDEPADVSGLFYKLAAYHATDDFRVAPAILTKGIDWYGKPKPEGGDAAERESMLDWSMTSLLTLAVVAIAVALIVVGVVWKWSNRPPPELPETIDIPDMPNPTAASEPENDVEADS